MPKVSVDEELCVGTADCARLAPLAFRVDEDVNASVVLPGADSADAADLLAAARACPTNAIRVVADDGRVLYESA